MPFHNPFGVLRGLTGDKTVPQDAAPEAAQTTTPDAPAPQNAPTKGPARAVVRMERSGRGGKEVTIVSHLALSPADLDKWMKDFKTALGCGGRVEDDTLLLQGDQRKRLPALLTARGVKKITVA